MLPRKVSVRKIQGRALEQIELAKNHAELHEFLPFAPGQVEIELASVDEAVSSRNKARQAAQAATQRAAEKAFRLNDMVNRNIAAVEAKFGKYADELLWVGGSPVRPGKRGSRTPGAADASADAA